MRKTITVLVASGFVFVFSFNLALAQVIINEIAWKGMSSGGTHEWLELHNTGSNSEDISGWVITDDGAQLNIVIPADTSISSGGFYVIKRNTATVTPFNLAATFNGGLLDSGEKIILSDQSGTAMDIVDFLAGWPNSSMTSDQTMQKNGSSWITAAGTPGASNDTVDTGSNDTSNQEQNQNEENTTTTTSTTSSNSSSNTSSKSSTNKTGPKLSITAPSVAFVGMPFELKGESGMAGGKYFWNFGDGNSIETKDSKSFNYEYPYEGEYAITLEYYSKPSSRNPDATATKTIKVVPMTVVISRVGDAADFFVEISNNTSYEMDVSGWKLVSYSKSFIFPRNTKIFAKKKLILASKTTNLNFLDKNSLKLINDAGFEIDNYSEAPVYRKAAMVNTPKTHFVGTALPLQEVPDEMFTAENNLSSSALSAGADLSKENSKNNYFYIAIFVLFVIGSTASVYFIRRKGGEGVQNKAEDFELID